MYKVIFMSKIKFLAKLLFISILAASCKPDPKSEMESEINRFQQYVIKNDFGLCPGEISLTIDDGPYGFSLDLAIYLANTGVPATFFMTGKQIRQFKNDVIKLLKLKLPNGKYAHNIANHSEYHSFAVRTRIENAYDIAIEIKNTNNLIDEVIKEAGLKDDPRFHKFYRPPFGTYSGKDIAVFLNEFVTEKGYKELGELVGPVFWHTGGVWDNTKQYGADWKCWSYNPETNSSFANVSECGQRYLNEIEDKRFRGQVLLVHDVNRKTFEMLTGEDGIIERSRKHGYKWVRLDKNMDRINIMKNYADYEGGPSFPAVTCPELKIKTGLRK